MAALRQSEKPDTDYSDPAPQEQPENEDSSRIDRDYQDRFNDFSGESKKGNKIEHGKYPGKTSASLRDQESQGNTPNSGSVADREQSSSGGWKNNTSANKTESKKKTSAGNKFGKIKNFKKAGPLGILSLFLIGGAGMMSIIGGPSMLIVQFVETIEEKFNHQLSVMEIRTNRIYRAKLSNTTTDICSPVKLRCKYSTFSSKQVQQFKDAGIEFGESKSKFGGREQPKTLKFDGKTISAEDFNKELNSNSKFNSAVKKVYSPRYAGFSDSIFKKISEKFGTSKTKPFSADADSDEKRLNEVKEKTKKGISNENDGIHLTDGDGSTECTGECETRTNQANEVAGNLDEAAANETSDANKLSKAASTSGIRSATAAVSILGAVDNACQAYGVYKAVSLGVKIIRNKQLIRFFMVIATTSSEIRAGTATPEDISYIGDLLTKVVKEQSGNLTKSATDSFGYRYAAFGDKGIDESAGVFSNGGSFGGEFSNIGDTIASFFGEKGGDDTCRINNNGFVQAGALIGSIALMFVPGANVALVSGKTIAQVAVEAIKFAAMILLPSILTDILSGNIIDENTFGEIAGNASVSGGSSMLSASALAGGGIPLTASQAAANQPLYAYVNDEYAKLDRTDLSPYDISSKNTFLGSIYNKFLPTIASIQSGNMLSIFKSFANISTGSFSNIMKVHAAEPETYDECNDLEYNKLGLATDPFCGVVSGSLSADVMSQNPDDIIARMISRGDIDEDGNPVGEDYTGFLEKCIDREYPLGNTGPDSTYDDGSSCMVNDSTTAMTSVASLNDDISSLVYATTDSAQWKPSSELTAEEVATQKLTDYYIFNIDQRITDSMENGYAYGADGGSSSSSSSSSSGDAIGEPELEESQGAWGGQSNGEIPDSELQSLSFSPQQKLHPKAAEAMEAMNAAYKAETGSDLVINEGYRTFSSQQSLYSSGQTQATPGTSNHGWGLAADINVGGFSSSIYIWLDENAHKYGFVNPDWAKNRSNPKWYKDEPWHWEYARKVG